MITWTRFQAETQSNLHYNFVTTPLFLLSPRLLSKQICITQMILFYTCDWVFARRFTLTMLDLLCVSLLGLDSYLQLQGRLNWIDINHMFNSIFCPDEHFLRTAFQQIWKMLFCRRSVRSVSGFFPPRLIPIDVSPSHGAFPHDVFPLAYSPPQSQFLTLAFSHHRLIPYLIVYSPLTFSPHRLILRPIAYPPIAFSP